MSKPFKEEHPLGKNSKPIVRLKYQILFVRIVQCAESFYDS